MKKNSRNLSSSKLPLRKLIHINIRPKSKPTIDRHKNSHSVHILSTSNSFLRNHRKAASHSNRDARQIENSQVKTNRENSEHSQKTINLRSNRIHTINDFHKYPKKKTIKKRLCICVVSSMIVAIIFIIIALLISFTLLFKSQTATTTSSISIQNPCVSGVYWNTSGTIYAGGNSQGSALNLLSSPMGISMNSKDNLYISDTGNARIIKYTPGASNGIVVAGGSPSGNALNQLSLSIRFTYADSNENIYISDSGNHRIMRWSNGASTGSIVAGNGTAGTSLNQLYNPYSVWVDSNSNVFVAEHYNNRVTQWSPGATAGVIVAGGNGMGSMLNQLSSPSGLSYDETRQDLYIVNFNSGSVIKWHIGDTNGTIVGGIPGTSGSTSTQLRSPLGITLDRWNNIYIADRDNSRVQLFCNGNSTGITIAEYSIGSTLLLLPFGVALDSQLNLYVSDNAMARVYKFTKL